MSFFFSLGLVVVDAVACDVTTAATAPTTAATGAVAVADSVASSTLVVVRSVFSPSTFSASFNFLFRTSFSPLDSDTVRLFAAEVSSVFDVSDAIKSIQMI